MMTLLQSVFTCVSPMVPPLIRVGLGCVFLSSSLPKLRQPYDFLSNVYNYQLVGPNLGLLVAMALPWLELIVGICLIAGIFVSGALLLSAGMAAMFTFALGATLYRGLAISCGCFSASTNDVVSYMTLIRATAILLVSVGAYAAVTLRQPKHFDPVLAQPKQHDAPTGTTCSNPASVPLPQ